MSNDNPFAHKYIEPFVWEELSGKTLKIGVGICEDQMVVLGMDVETKKRYVLHSGPVIPLVHHPIPGVKAGKTDARP